MSVADILTQPDPTGSLSRFVLEAISGVIEGDARAALGGSCCARHTCA